MLSQTTEYALRAMACLAGRPDQLTPTPVLAKQTAVPANYLAKVLQALAQADLISGRRGVGGGYRLARPRNEITLLEVVNAISPLGRADRGLVTPEVTDQAHLKTLHATLDAATQHVSDMLASITLQDLLDDRVSGNTPRGGSLPRLALQPHAADGSLRNGDNGMGPVNGRFGIAARNGVAD